MSHGVASAFVTDWLDKRARLTPERVAIENVTGETVLTYREWNHRVNRTAHFLQRLGVKKGDRVSVYASNCIEYLDVLFACGKFGAILHHLNWRLTVHELRSMIDDAEPRVLIYSGDWCEQVNELRPHAQRVIHFIAMDARAHPDDLALDERDTMPGDPPARPNLRPDDPWAIFYTGGTTGLPKGAVLTHANMTWNSINTVVSWGLTRDDAAPLQLPLFHIGGPNIFMLPLVHVGGRTILCRGFDVEETFDLIDSGRINLYVGVPTMYIMMQQHPRWAQVDFSRMKLVISGGAPCPRPVMQAFWDKGVDFKLGYGLTEATGNNFWLPDSDVRRKPGSVGFPLFHVDAKIIRPDGSECGPDEAGELLLRGPHIFAGYWQKPEETQQALRDGWLHTGDLARRDAEGYFTIIGRSKEMFISGGENVYPAEIESVLHGHPAVAEVAVIGVPHDKWGEVGEAFVVLQEGETVDEASLRNYLSERLAKYKIPQRIRFIPELPKTAIGKIDKEQLRQMAIKGGQEEA